MARQSANESGALWPFLNKDRSVMAGAETVLSARGGYRNGYRNGYRGALRARMSALDSPGGRAGVTLGWHPDMPDMRDKRGDRSGAQRRFAIAAKSVGKKWSAAPPKRVANLRWCSPIEDQGDLGSCTAQAVVSLAEYMQRRAGVRHVDGSRLFVYKVTRKLMGWTGDTGAYLRTAIQAVATFGIPPEEHFPYIVEQFEDEPSAFLYSYAQNYQFLKYVRIDTPDRSPKDVEQEIKRVLSIGLGVVFGFSVYSSLETEPDIPYPTQNDRLEGGHAVMAVGYDDNHKLPDGTKCPSLIIRNSWGTGWGVGGYGFLPYAYIRNGLARDFWTVLKTEWIDLQQFDETDTG